MFDRNCCQARQNNEFNAEFNADTMNVDMDVNLNQGGMMPAANMGGVGPVMGGTTQSPIIEPMQERQVHRTIMHEVPHVCPMRTKVINHHVFRHTYQPSYSCCEVNTCSTINCGSCCNFR